MQINEMKINNKKVQEAKVNGQIVYKLISDIEPPEYVTLRVTNISRKDPDGNWSQMAQKGDKIRIIVTMNEELDSSYYPMLKINEKVISRRMGYDNNMKAYTYDYTIQDEPDGQLQFEISDYRDLAGNIGRTLTNEDFNVAGQTSITVDNTPPVVTIKTGASETIGNATDGYTKISFKLYDNVGVNEYELNGIKGKISVSQWSDLNNITTSFNGVIVGLNTLIVRDTAGNEAVKEFKLIEG